MLCGNSNCIRGKGKRRGKRASFRKRKAWSLYCSRECGDAVRRLRYYYAGKKGKAGA